MMVVLLPWPFEISNQDQIIDLISKKRLMFTAYHLFLYFLSVGMFNLRKLVHFLIFGWHAIFVEYSIYHFSYISTYFNK